MQSQPNLNIVTEFPDNNAIARLNGELISTSSDSFGATIKALLEHDPEYVILDFRNLTMIDSSGINQIMRHHRMADQSGIKIIIVGAGVTITKILQLIKLDLIIDILSIEELEEKYDITI